MSYIGIPVAVVIVSGLLIWNVYVLYSVGLNLQAFQSGNHAPPVTIEHWNTWTSTQGSMFQVIIGVSSVVLAVVATILVTLRVESKKSDDEKNRTAIRLSEMMYDKDFYVGVTGPSWEVASKWLYWDDKDGQGDRYRVQVAIGFIDSLSVDNIFSSIENANSRDFHNRVRSVHHFVPYDVGGQVFSELSEHMALMTWFQFWNHIVFLLQRNLVSGEAITVLFSSWYSSWYPFMFQYRVAGLYLSRLYGLPIQATLSRLELLEVIMGLRLPDAVSQMKRGIIIGRMVAQHYEDTKSSSDTTKYKMHASVKRGKFEIRNSRRTN